MTSQATLPQFLSRTENSMLSNVAAVLAGAGLLTLLAQISIRLPWTPVPITGQTLGVALIGLSWGWKRGLASVAFYLVIGAIGLPVFANAQNGFLLGPTMGYLIGMLFAGTLDGFLADNGWTRSFWRAIGAAYIGSIVIYVCGLAVLANYVPPNKLLAAGLYPFLVGDLIKNLIASGISFRVQKRLI